MSKPISRFEIHNTFRITGRGIVLAGLILNGEFNVGDVVEFSFNGQIITRKIKAIDNKMRVTKGNANTGVMIECLNDKEINALRDWNPNLTIGEIYNELNE